MSLRATHRDAGQVTVVDLSGRITLGDGSALLRKTIRGLLDDQRKNILLNLADVDYIDSTLCLTCIRTKAPHFKASNNPTQLLLSSVK